MAARSFAERNKEIIANAKNAEDLGRLFEQIPLSDIKQFVLDQTTKSKDESKARQIYYNSASIEDILSSDEIQSILVYVFEQRSIVGVSKLFRKLGNKNYMLMNDYRKTKLIISWYCNTYTSVEGRMESWMPLRPKYLSIKKPGSAFEIFDAYKVNDPTGIKYSCMRAQFYKKQKQNKREWKKMNKEQKAIWKKFESRERREWKKVNEIFDKYQDWSKVPRRWLRLPSRKELEESY